MKQSIHISFFVFHIYLCLYLMSKKTIKAICQILGIYFWSLNFSLFRLWLSLKREKFNTVFTLYYRVYSCTYYSCILYGCIHSIADYSIHFWEQILQRTVIPCFCLLYFMLFKLFMRRSYLYTGTLYIFKKQKSGFGIEKK